MLYTVAYVAGTYSGVRQVNAEDEEEALARVRKQIRREMTLPMYSEKYTVERVENPEEEADTE